MTSLKKNTSDGSLVESRERFFNPLIIFEILKTSPTVVQLTLERADASKIEEAAKKEGMTTLIDDGIKKILSGQTTIEEVLTVAMSY